MDNIGMESETVEFKESTTELRDGIEALVAMLNKNGRGEVFFGVRNNGDVIGQDVGKNTLRSISQKVFENVEPSIVPTIEVLTASDGKKYISLSATGKDRPYFSQGMVFVRSGEENRKAPPSEIRRMFMSTGDPITEETSNNQELTFNELCTLLRNNGKDVSDDARMHTSLGLLNESGRFNLMAQLLSDQNPFQLTVATFNGLDRMVLSLRKDYSGHCLLSETISVSDYVENQNEVIVDMSKAVRVDTDLFDFDAFREAWLNACVHNNWLSHIPPAVHIFDDRLEVISTGGIPYWLSESDFFRGRSMPVNEALMRVFIATGLCEHTGHGVPIVVEKYGEKAYQINDGSVRVTIPFLRKRSGALSRSYDTGQHTERELLLLDALETHPDYTISKLAELTGLSRSLISKTIPKLKKAGIVERNGSNKKGIWIVHRGRM